MNGDGRADFLVSDTTAKQLLAISSTTDGGFGTTNNQSVPTLQGVFALSDMDRSGTIDVVAGLDGSEGLAVLAGNGNGTFGASQTVVNSRRLTSLCTADFNQDGLIDVAATSRGDGNFYVYLNSANGQAYPRRFTSLPDDRYAYALACGDFDCDGKPDVVIGTTGQNRIAVFFGDGSGQFSASVSSGTTAEPRDVLVGDIDGDGRNDIVFYDQYGDVQAVLGSGSRVQLAAAQAISGPRATASLQIGDVNRDGKPDLLLVDQYKTVMTLLNSTP